MVNLCSTFPRRDVALDRTPVIRARFEHTVPLVVTVDLGRLGVSLPDTYAALFCDYLKRDMIVAVPGEGPRQTFFDEGRAYVAPAMSPRAMMRP